MGFLLYQNKRKCRYRFEFSATLDSKHLMSDIDDVIFDVGAYLLAAEIS
jgi:hypothetical protein